jgi:glycine dehydrogenase subunit 1
MAGSVNPQYRSVLETYLRQIRCELVVVPTPNGVVDPDRMAAAVNDRTSCVVFQHPNFFGCLEDAAALTAIARKHGALSVVSFDPVSLGLLSRPADFGADVAVAEGQALGTPLQFGGPYLGLFACRQEYVRKMPGRLIGESVDRHGQRCFVLNLQAREQHIRRDKATSNICSNQGLIALRATAYLSLLGPRGLRELAELCVRKTHYAAGKLASVPGVRLQYAAPFFREFVLHVESGADAAVNRAAAAGFAIGPTLADVSSCDESTRRNGVLVAVTERRSKAEIDALADALAP